MLIKLPPASTPPGPPSKQSKPPLHTRKNHDSYNGTLHLPLTTHTQYLPASHSSNPHYLITLAYPHNRACTLFRSPADVLTLRQGLAIAAADPVLEGEDDNSHGDEHDGNNNDESKGTVTTADLAAATAIERMWCRACVQSCSCACTCACADGGGGRPEARLAREVNLMLGQAVEKMRSGKKGSGGRVVVEWFLRRRFGDCEGGGSSFE